MRKKTLTALMAIGIASIVSSRAQAQTTAGALQLGVGTNFLTYSSANITQHNTPIDNAGTLGDLKTIERNTTWGLSNRNGVSLEGGYGITDSLVLGGILEMGDWSNTTGPDGMSRTVARNKESMFSLFIGPKLDYMLLPESVVRPFFGVALGLVRRTDTRESTLLNAAGAAVTTTDSDVGLTGVGLQGRAGIRWFLTPGFSLDPAFVFGFTSASGSISVPAGAGATRSYDMSASGYTVGLRVAFSGWIGL